MIFSDPFVILSLLFSSIRLGFLFCGQKKSLARGLEILYILSHDRSSISGKSPTRQTFDIRDSRANAGDD